MMKSRRSARARDLVAVVLALGAASAACNSYEPLWATNPDFNNVVGSLSETLALPDGGPATALTVNAGGSSTFNATVTPAGGFTGPVEFSPVGSPLGVSISPAGIDIEGTAPVTVALTLSAAQSTPAGTQTVTIAAAADNQAAEAALSLTVDAYVSPYSPLIASAANLTFALGDPAQSVTASEAGYSGAFSETDTCVTVATIAMPGAGVFSVAPFAAGSCTLTIADANGQSVNIPIVVSGQ